MHASSPPPPGTVPVPRRWRRLSRRRWFVVAAIVAFILFRVRCWWCAEPEREAGRPMPEGDYAVLRVVDGDTLIVRRRGGIAETPTDDSEYRVRLLGIDCPESVKPDQPVEPWALEAAEFTRQAVANTLVRLQFDRRRVDQYHRRLAYVFVGDKLLNEELVRAGLAHVRVYAGDSQSMARRLRTAEREARANARGVWAQP
jgi:micrococcal nuclease